MIGKLLLIGIACLFIYMGIDQLNETNEDHYYQLKYRRGGNIGSPHKLNGLQKLFKYGGAIFMIGVGGAIGFLTLTKYNDD